MPDHCGNPSTSSTTWNDRGGPPGPGANAGSWASGFNQVAGHQNVVAKMSGVTSGLAKGGWSADDLRPYVDYALDAFGPERLMYGSDWPLAELGGGAPAWTAALESLLGGQTASDRERIFGSTAAAVYSLD
ncbi:amidohydrolase family protein [Diaminobutyricibacter sp. McL0608]|uniref:amidohydrolase family protein n=1 Tax=Leifsonia sp. McL0608 TaxID=3143537 RepID=UPI0031F32488